MLDWIIGGLAIALLVIGVIVLISLPRQRQVVSRDEAHVIIKRDKVHVYSGTPEVTGFQGSTYYELPGWVPFIGLDVTKVPLSVVEIKVPEMVTFTAQNARFTLTASVYVRVVDPLKAAQRWPGRAEETFKSSVSELIQNAIRNTTTAFAAEEIIEKKDEIAAKLQQALASDMDEYGCIISNVAVVNITDAPDTTVISDIARKREAEINAESRQMVALRDREARIVEAENRELAENREAASTESIGVRKQEKERSIVISKHNVAEEEMKIEQVRQVRAAEIEKAAAIERAEGERQAAILKRQGEAEGTRATGLAEAEVIRSRGLAEAEVIRSRGLAEAETITKRVEALNSTEESGRWFREIEKDENIGIELAKALQQAQIRFVSTGEVSSFLNLLSASGGANVGAMFAALRETEPELVQRLEQVLAGLGKSAGSG
ncbi:hypothetical protein LR032_00545 [Candidatus Bipolaricaulota bacterium]|nr:hypothetical protein [Candidatus Bipolaricaulota bacterium]